MTQIKLMDHMCRIYLWIHSYQLIVPIQSVVIHHVANRPMDYWQPTLPSIILFLSRIPSKTIIINIILVANLIFNLLLIFICIKEDIKIALYKVMKPQPILPKNKFVGVHCWGYAFWAFSSFFSFSLFTKLLRIKWHKGFKNDKIEQQFLIIKNSN